MSGGSHGKHTVRRGNDEPGRKGIRLADQVQEMRTDGVRGAGMIALPVGNAMSF